MPALLSSEQLIKSLAETVPQMVWCSDAGGNKTYCSQRYLAYTGAKDLSELDRSWASYIHPDDRPTVVDEWQRSLTSGQPYECRYRLRRFDGVYREFLAQAKAVFGVKGEVLRWIGASTDLHDQKQLEEARRRTEKLAVAGRLAASIAHEVNNPLSSATNALFLAMQDATLPDLTRYYLELVERELRRIATLTRQTLRFHRQSDAPILIDMREVVDAAVKAALATNTASVHLQLESRYCPKLLCYTEDIRQALASVIRNSLDAMMFGGRLKVRVRPAQAAKSKVSGVRITIADSGHGIPHHLLPDVGEPFVTTKEATGTGLGLWVTKGIMDRHHGTLQIRSATIGRWRGTTVALFLPYTHLEENRSTLK